MKSNDDPQPTLSRTHDSAKSTSSEPDGTLPLPDSDTTAQRDDTTDTAEETADGDQHEVDATLSVAQAGSPQSAKTSDRPQPLAAETVFGEYELVEQIARGGMGVVYKAKQRTLNRTVALKMILAGHLAGEDEILRFRSEAEAAAGLDHPGIVPIYEVGQQDGQHFFSMGFVEGASLAARIAESPLNSRDAAEMLLHVAIAVEYAHQRGIVHRDLKPANVLLKASAATGSGSKVEVSASSGGSTSTTGRGTLSGSQPSSLDARPMITDFGLAKRLESDSNLTASGQILGTPSYMPPEQASGLTDRIDARSDVYSSGAMLYCMLTGRPPFHAASLVETIRHVIELDPVPPRQINPEISRDLETICLKCLEKEPARRYQTAQALAEDLQAFLDGRPVKSRPVGALGKLSRWARRKPLVASLAVAVILLTVGGIAGIVWQWRVAQANFDQSQKYLAASEEHLTQAKSAQQLAYEAQSRAEKSFDLARTTVKRFLTIVPNHELVQQPGMEPLKEQLQTLGRDYYLMLSEARPDDYQVRAGLAQSHFYLGMTMEDVGKLESAATEYTLAATIFQQLADRDPDLGEHRRNLAACYGNLANVQVNLGQRAAGIETYRRIRDMQQSILDKHPTDSIAAVHLSMTHLNLGLLELEDQQLVAAMQSATKATEMAEALQVDHADDIQIQFVLAKALSTQGRLHWERQENPAALADYVRAQAAYQALLAANPGQLQFHAEISEVFNDMAMIHMEQNDRDEAEKNWKLVFHHGRTAHLAAPEVWQFRQSLFIKQRNGGLHFRNTGQFDLAISHLVESRELSLNEANWLYTTATDMAGFATMIDENRDKLPPAAIGRRGEFIDKAIVWLAAAIEHGYDDVANIESDPMLDNLRTQPAFVDLLDGLRQAKAAKQLEATKTDEEIGTSCHHIAPQYERFVQMGLPSLHGALNNSG